MPTHLIFPDFCTYPFIRLPLRQSTYIMKVNNTNKFQCQMDSDLLEYLSERSICATKVTALLDLVSRRVPEATTVTPNFHPIEIPAGCAFASLTDLAADWKWDRKKVYRFVNRLETLGVIQSRNLMYGTLFYFPFLSSDGTPRKGPDCPSQNQPDGTPRILADNLPKLDDPSDSISVSHPIVQDFRYNARPLDLSEDTEAKCRMAYELFQKKLPKLELPPYSQRTQKAIYNVFILGMQEDSSQLEQLLDLVAADDYMNGEVAEMTGCSADKESFRSLFSCKWQELLFPENNEP